MQSAYIDSSEITIDVREGRVIIEGTVPERRMKHAIEDVADSVAGVNDVENKVRVNQGGAQDRSSGGDFRSSGSNTSTASRGPGSSQSPAGQSTSSTAKPASE
jgi:hypothetical protein